MLCFRLKKCLIFQPVFLIFGVICLSLLASMVAYYLAFTKEVHELLVGFFGAGYFYLVYLLCKPYMDKILEQNKAFSKTSTEKQEETNEDESL